MIFDTSKRRLTFLFFIERKQNRSHAFASSLTSSNKACEIDMISLRNHAPWSYIMIIKIEIIIIILIITMMMITIIVRSLY